MACHSSGIDYLDCMEVVFNTGGEESVVDLYHLFQYVGVAAILFFAAWVLSNSYDAVSSRKVGYSHQHQKSEPDSIHKPSCFEQ